MILIQILDEESLTPSLFHDFLLQNVFCVHKFPNHIILYRLSGCGTKIWEFKELNNNF